MVFRRGLVLAVMMMLLFLTACAGSSGPSTESGATTDEHEHQVEGIPYLEAVRLAEGERLHVVATTSIVGDVVAQVGGEAIELTVLLQPGQDPHAYQPSAQDLATVAQADIILVNGFDLEESLLENLEGVAERRIGSLRGDEETFMALLEIVG